MNLFSWMIFVNWFSFPVMYHVNLFCFHQTILLTMAGMEVRREDVVLPEDQAGRLAFVLHNVLTPEVIIVQ